MEERVEGLGSFHARHRLPALACSGSTSVPSTPLALLVALLEYFFIWLHSVLVAACKIFSCGMWDLVP